MITDSYATLSSSTDDRALQQGFEANVHDPAWFLARQWQMGEHQGENASTPMTVNYTLQWTPIPPSASAPLRDPRLVPAEAIIEAEPDDAWTMGRRIRVGQRLKDLVPNDDTRPSYFIRAPSPPYESFHGAVDGLQLWRNRARLPPGTDFGPDVPGSSGEFAWSSTDLHYDRSFPALHQGLVVQNHRGGQVDWFSADAASQLQAGTESEVRQPVIPTPLQYPGAPANRFWQIEDADVDIGGYPPDMAHFSTILLVDLIYSHGDDWFLMPVTVRAGTIARLKDITVRDSFNIDYRDTDPRYKKGLSPPSDWSLFNTRGLDAGQLVIWNVAETPIESILLEQVQFGVDEASNLIWAVERIIDGRESQSVPSLQPAEAGQTSAIIKGAGDMTVARSWRYLPSDPPQRFWHPYIQEEGTRQFTQHGLADLTQVPPKPLDRPEAEVLRVRGPAGQTLHTLSPGSIPSNGISLERRWMLARDIEGNPVLWVQRERKPLVSPPTRRLRFDVAASIAEA